MPRFTREEVEAVRRDLRGALPRRRGERGGRRRGRREPQRPWPYTYADWRQAGVTSTLCAGILREQPHRPQGAVQEQADLRQRGQPERGPARQARHRLQHPLGPRVLLRRPRREAGRGEPPHGAPVATAKPEEDDPPAAVRRRGQQGALQGDGGVHHRGFMEQVADADLQDLLLPPARHRDGPEADRARGRGRPEDLREHAGDDLVDHGRAPEEGDPKGRHPREGGAGGGPHCCRTSAHLLRAEQPPEAHLLGREQRRGVPSGLQQPLHEPPPQIQRRERQVVKERQGGLCAVNSCGAELGDKFDIDHITPLIHGGTNDAENLQAMCCSCHKAQDGADVLDGRRHQRQLEAPHDPLAPLAAALEGTPQRPEAQGGRLRRLRGTRPSEPATSPNRSARGACTSSTRSRATRGRRSSRRTHSRADSRASSAWTPGRAA